MNAIFIISKNSKTYDPHRLLLNLLDKIDLKWSDISVALSNLRIYYTIHGKISKVHTKTLNLKIQIFDQMWLVILMVKVIFNINCYQMINKFQGSANLLKMVYRLMQNFPKLSCLKFYSQEILILFQLCSFCLIQYECC